MTESDREQHDHFLRLFMEHEESLRVFVRSLLFTHDEEREVMQEVAVVLWRKFDPSMDSQTFCRWAWNSSDMFDNVLQHVGRTVPLKAKDHGWQTLQSRMEIPPGTRSLVIWLAVIEGDGEGQAGAHYIDDIQASFILTDTQP